MCRFAAVIHLSLLLFIAKLSNGLFVFLSGVIKVRQFSCWQIFYYPSRGWKWFPVYWFDIRCFIDRDVAGIKLPLNRCFMHCETGASLSFFGWFDLLDKEVFTGCNPPLDHHKRPLIKTTDSNHTTSLQTVCVCRCGFSGFVDGFGQRSKLSRLWLDFVPNFNDHLYGVYVWYFTENVSKNIIRKHPFGETTIRRNDPNRSKQPAIDANHSHRPETLPEKGQNHFLGRYVLLELLSGCCRRRRWRSCGAILLGCLCPVSGVVPETEEKCFPILPPHHTPRSVLPSHVHKLWWQHNASEHMFV